MKIKYKVGRELVTRDNYISLQHVTVAALRHGEEFARMPYYDAVQFAANINSSGEDTQIKFVAADGSIKYTKAGSLLRLLQNWSPEEKLVVDTEQGGIRFDRTEKRKKKV